MKKLTEEHKRKISEALKGRPSNNPFKKGHPCFCREGFTGQHSEESKRKMSDTRKRLNAFGDKSPNWKGGRQERADGYILICVDKKRVLEHRYVAEKLLGRKLKKKEVVHHVNEIRSDNRPENIMVFTDSGAHRVFHRTGSVDKSRIVFDGRTPYLH